MNKEEIIALALEHGISSSTQNILAFAKAFQDKQRESDAKICEDILSYDEDDPMQTCADAIRNSNKE